MRSTLATTILCATIGLVAAGCGGSQQTSSGTEPATQQQPGSAPGGPSGSGKVVDVSGSTAQVQGQSSQVAVSWTGKTTFTRQVTAKASAVKVGSCVTVTSAEADDSASATTVTAATVRVTEPVDGDCAGGLGGGRPGGGGKGARPTDMPTDMPTDRPSGAPDDARRGGFATGKVTAVTSSGFTVASQQPGADSDSTTLVTVATSADTTYTATASATAAAVKTGVCVTSRGDADDTGAITATTIAITQPVDGECTAGFGGRPGGRTAGE